MKWLTLFLLLNISAFSQKYSNLPYQQQTQKIQPQYVVTQEWRCANQGNWGSFWWRVERTQFKQSDGYYYYYIYAYSNSFLNEYSINGSYVKATTYISDIKAWILNSTVSVSVPYQVVDYQKEVVAYFWYTLPNAVININYGSVYPYDYSNQ